MNEFNLISHYFDRCFNGDTAKAVEALRKKGVNLGIGDDAAVFTLKPGESLVSSMDTLVNAVHFPENSSAADIAYKCLAVNLSDLAAMGAKPHSFLLSITLPSLDGLWLQQFSSSLFELADASDIVLIGGDTSQGPLSISVQINGTVKNLDGSVQALKRSSAKANELIFTTGYLGLAKLGLQEWLSTNKAESKAAQQRFLQPEARLAFAQGLYDLGARSAIDISDGLIADLGHICEMSQVTAKIDVDALLYHEELKALNKKTALEYVLAGGDDYELCFTASAEYRNDLENHAQQQGVALSCIGEMIEREDGGARVQLFSQTKKLSTETITDLKGYQHFA